MHSKPAIAVIGAGKWGQNLIKTLAQSGNLRAIADPDVNKKELAQAYQVPFYTEVESLLATSIDAVVIATPVSTHFEVATKALLAKKDVFVEKPITQTADEAAELMQLAHINDRILMVGHLLLYQPAIRFIKGFIEEGKLGEIFSYRQIRRSLGTIRLEENVLYSLGVHDLAVLHYLNDEPLKRIIASAQHVLSTEIADEMNIHFSYESGKQAHLHLNWLWPIKDRQLMILGEKGALHFDELQQEVIFHQNYGTRNAVIQKGSEIIFVDKTPPLSLELAHFIECITTRRQPISCGRQGHDVVALMAKIMEAEKRSHDTELLYT